MTHNDESPLDDGDLLAVLDLTVPQLRRAAAQLAWLLIADGMDDFVDVQLRLLGRSVAGPGFWRRALVRLTPALGGGAELPSSLRLELFRQELKFSLERLGVFALKLVDERRQFG